MKKCISCQQEIDDGAVFCPLCGAKQDAEMAKLTFPVTERAFCRIFRPSFFGGLQINRDTMYGFMNGFLSLTREMTGDEITAVNHAFDTLLNNASDEYSLSDERKKYEASYGKYAIDGAKRIQIESEKFRYNFVSDTIFHTMEQFYKTSRGVGTKHYGNVWLFSLLSALDGNYSDEKLMFFRRMKNLFPVTREQFLESIAPSEGRYNSNDDMNSIFGLFRLISGMEAVSEINLGYNGSISYKTDSGESGETSVENLKGQIPEDFDFYALVEKKTKALCETEYEILQLESSEGKYDDIADKIAELARKERELTAFLPGFVYQKF